MFYSKVGIIILSLVSTLISLPAIAQRATSDGSQDSLFVLPILSGSGVFLVPNPPLNDLAPQPSNSAVSGYTPRLYYIDHSWGSIPGTTSDPGGFLCQNMETFTLHQLNLELLSVNDREAYLANDPDDCSAKLTYRKNIFNKLYQSFTEDNDNNEEL
ncbi:MAG: hypothetical protein AAFQ80_15115 [Cyanobacteria bacterium J06621_8]